MATDRSLARAIIERSFRRPFLTIVLTLAGAALGTFWLLDLERDVFPDLSTPVFNVIVQNPTMGPEELEVAITIPMEGEMSGLPGVRRVRSSSGLGVSTTTVEFEPDEDYYRARQFVSERAAQVGARLPPGTEPPLVSSLTGRLNEILEFTLESDGSVDLLELRDLAEFDVRNRLLAVSGVAAVERLGGELREYQVLIEPVRMDAREVSLGEVLDAAAGSSRNAAAGIVAEGPVEWSVRTVAMAESPAELGSTVVAMRDGVPVRLSDVATIEEGPAIRRGLARRLGREVVSARVSKQFGSDTVEVARAVRHAIDEIRRGLPEGVELRIVYDQSQLVQASLSGVGRAVIIGALFVILILFLLLGDVRAALVVTLTMPLSIGLAGIILELTGVGLNTMTLGGLAIAVGLLVDASIIMTENIAHRMAQKRSVPRAVVARSAASEVGRPIAFAVLIVVAVFTPLFAMSGIEGRMYQPLAGAVIAAVLASLVLSLTFVPVLCAVFLRPRPEGKGEDVWAIRKIKRVYAPLLDACMRRAGLVRIVTLLITIPALALAFFVGSEFMPELDQGALLLQTVLPPETALEEVDRLNMRVEDLIRQVPEVEDVVRRTGRAERTEDPMPHTISDILVVLRPERGRSIAEIEHDLRENLEDLPAITVLFTTPLGMRIDEGLGGTPADLAVRIFGPDLDTLSRLANRAQEIVSEVEGIADLRVERMASLPQIRVDIDREATARAGLRPADVVDAVRIGLVGDAVSTVWVGQRRHDVVVRLDEASRDAGGIESLIVDAANGNRVPLGQLASIERTFGPGTIRREGSSRRIAVEASVEGRDLGSTAAEVEERLSEALQMPEGYFMNLSGRVESQQRSARSLMIAVGIAIFAVMLLLVLALDSAAEAAVILATLPDALVGGILALLIAGETWNVSSLVGLIGLFGIAVQNGLVLIAQTKDLEREGKPFAEALREASIGRVRPKLMTAGTAILGLLPLLVFQFHGTEIERPLAIVMIGGLVTSTLFTLFALPTFYALVRQWQEKRTPLMPLDEEELAGGRI